MSMLPLCSTTTGAFTRTAKREQYGDASLAQFAGGLLPSGQDAGQVETKFRNVQLQRFGEIRPRNRSDGTDGSNDFRLSANGDFVEICNVVHGPPSRKTRNRTGILDS